MQLKSATTVRCSASGKYNWKNAHRTFHKPAQRSDVLYSVTNEVIYVPLSSFLNGEVANNDGNLEKIFSRHRNTQKYLRRIN